MGGSSTKLMKKMSSNYINVPHVTFYNGQSVPIIGIGTWQSKPGEVYDAIKTALEIGIRHIDGAQVYMNESEIGKAINDTIQEGVLTRDELFITSKLWNTFHRKDLVEEACRKTLQDLGTEYLDLYLIHFPMAFKEGGALFPTDESKKVQFSDVDYLETWYEMEKLVQKGLVKNIGVSNFNKNQLERILDNSSIKPVTNQVECHPYLPQRKLLDWCHLRDITLTGYSPLGSPANPFSNPEEKGLNLMTEEVIVKLAQKHGKTPAQILIRYQIDRGIIVIPKSVRRERIIENFDVFDFGLTHKEIEEMNSLARPHGRVLDFPTWQGHQYYPFSDQY